MMYNYGANPMFKIIHLGGYVLRIDFLKLLNNDGRKCKQNSTVN